MLLLLLFVVGATVVVVTFTFTFYSCNLECCCLIVVSTTLRKMAGQCFAHHFFPPFLDVIVVDFVLPELDA